MLLDKRHCAFVLKAALPTSEDVNISPHIVVIIIIYDFVLIILNVSGVRIAFSKELGFILQTRFSHF